MNDVTALLKGAPPVPVPSPGSNAGGGTGAGGVPAVLPFPVQGHRTAHTLREGCTCDHCTRLRRDGFLRLLTPEQHASARLGHRAHQREAGLSNAAYRAASSGTQKLSIKVTPARIKVSLSDPLLDLLRPEQKTGAQRGIIRELSDASRDRLADKASTLQAEGHEAEVMLTLTAPANWEEVYLYDQDGVKVEGGPLFKSHMKAFKKRLERFLLKLGIPSWSALWFLEFQTRGAPHVHLILFGCTLPEPVRRSLRAWCGRAWSSVVGNPSKREQEKHRRAGTQVARMKKKHFGYAQKYATKTHQKEVPEEFERVGRFWGVWNYTSSAPIVLDVDYSRLNDPEAERIFSLLADVLATVDSYSPQFASSRLRRVENALLHGLRHKVGFSVYGESAAQTVLKAFS